ncbi:YqiA/YcfP family alpha/beta fold hydrolase [Parashewanella tropica]|uniref:YqiA/YcfP family alpha/beta fold hydrolase n=1 Tax=Parashewanella tropica TaxID=2547970 RepID=UPI0010597CF1|nr:YqiA/YcfP family alpha/beta fold hydrolase [Parashewanella tropica]
MLLYIHGFNSSPQSDKGRETAQFIAKHYPDLPFYQPQLPFCPKAAMELLKGIVENALQDGQALRFLGSSLGGYFATYLVEQYGGKAVLINPSVKPYDSMKAWLGQQYNPYTEEYFDVIPEHQHQLLKLDTPAIIHPEQIYVLQQAGDEVLDYRQAINKYHSCKMTLEAGGNHSFVGYKNHLPAIAEFLQLTNC